MESNRCFLRMKYSTTCSQFKYFLFVVVAAIFTVFWFAC